MRSRTGYSWYRLLAVILGAVAVVGSNPSAAHADNVRDGQWQLSALNATQAWRYSTGSGVTVAVLDSGVDASHPDLRGQVLSGVDLVDGSTDGRVDAVGHGTTVAALIAGRLDDDGVVGIAPSARILPIRVLDTTNRYQDATVVAQGVRWATDHGAQVINLSLGGLYRNDALAAALTYAAQHDVVVIACTGNVAQANGSPQVWYPAREPGVIAVTGLRAPPDVEASSSSDWAPMPGRDEPAEDGPLWSGALTGPQTVLSAPATDLLGARPGGYWRVQGTSFAAPLVAGAAALIRARYPGLSAGNVINRLIRTAQDLGDAGRDDQYGFGEIEPLPALVSEVEDVTANPLVAGGQPGTGAGRPVDPGLVDAAHGKVPQGAASGGGAPVRGLGGFTATPVERRRTDPNPGTRPVGPTLAIAALLAVTLFGASARRRYAVRHLRRRPRHAR